MLRKMQEETSAPRDGRNDQPARGVGVAGRRRREENVGFGVSGTRHAGGRATCTARPDQGKL